MGFGLPAAIGASSACPDRDGRDWCQWRWRLHDEHPGAGDRWRAAGMPIKMMLLDNSYAGHGAAVAGAVLRP
jgi:hypothetical protein